MKKLSAVLLSILMVLTCLVPMASAYDAAETASTAKTLLDWVDDKIADAMADFNAFKNSIGVDLGIADIDSLDDLLAYKDHAAALEGDFANLDTAALKTRADGDLVFINSVIDFMAANKEIFKKVFTWTPGTPFDYGKVGEYIEGLEDGNEIKDFYITYLKDGYDIQSKFVGEIAREMGCEIPDGEIFDDTLNNGIKQALAPVLKDSLKTDASKAAYDAFNLKTTDVYALVKAYIGLLQNDYKGDFDAILSSFLSALQGMVKVVESGVNLEPPTATIKDYGTFVAGPYTPGNIDPNSYKPTIYTDGQYKDMIAEAVAGVNFGTVEINGQAVEVTPAVVVTDEAVPEGLKVGEPTALTGGFKMEVAQGTDKLLDLAIDFDEIEREVNAEIAAQLPAIQTQVDAMVAQAVATANQMPIIGGSITGSVTINSVTVDLAYAGYKTDDSFCMEVTATPNYDITYGGNVWTYASMVGITQDKIEADYIQPVIAEYVKNPVATVSVSNLNGKIDELEQINELLDYIDTEAAYNDNLLNLMANYDQYKGAVGQVNHILYGLVDMILTDAGMADLGLVDGDNSNLYSNLQKICAKATALLDTMKQYIDRDSFIQLASAADISAAFASEHGFNAGMIYDMDFSSVENALDCGIRVACDLLAEDDPDSIFYEFHMRVEDLNTLDAILATTVDMILGKLLAKIDFEGWDYTYTAIDAETVDAGTVTAQNAVMDKIVDILYYAATFAVPKVNSLLNNLLADFGFEANLQLGVEQGETWEATLNALIDRFIDLTDGLFITGFDKSKGALAKLSDIAAAMLPMESMFSNYDSLTAMNDAFFTQAADGNFNKLLSYFEVKDDAIAGAGIPVTKALINASDRIVSAFFPTTVSSGSYDAGATVQEDFTGYANDPEIAARNMQDIADRKADLVPWVLNLLKEAGLAQAMAQDMCDHDGATTETVITASTCKTHGAASVVCDLCGKRLEDKELALDPANHEGDTEVRNAKAATCKEEGYTGDTYCLGCGNVKQTGAATPKSTAHNWNGGVVTKDATCTATGVKTFTCTVCGTTRTETINAKGHSWGNWVTTKEATEDEEGQRVRECSVCHEKQTETIGKVSTNFFQKIIKAIRGFFDRILGFFRNLF